MISFYNQRMQIRICWQPINHILAAMYWAARHEPVDISYSHFALRHSDISATKGIWDILRTFSFHLHLSSRVGCLSQESFVSGATEQLSTILFCSAGKQFEMELLYVVYFDLCRDPWGQNVFPMWVFTAKTTRQRFLFPLTFWFHIKANKLKTKC